MGVSRGLLLLTSWLVSGPLLAVSFQSTLQYLVLSRFTHYFP